VKEMTYRNILTIGAILGILFGLGFILVPTGLLSMYNVDLNAAGLVIAQLYGTALLGFGLVNWLARGVNDEGAKQAIVTGNLVGDAIGFVVSLIGQLGGATGVNALGWSTVLIYLLLTAGFAYLRFGPRQSTMPATR